MSEIRAEFDGPMVEMSFPDGSAELEGSISEKSGARVAEIDLVESYTEGRGLATQLISAFVMHAGRRM
jgi:hypothetical protein